MNVRSSLSSLVEPSIETSVCSRHSDASVQANLSMHFIRASASTLRGSVQVSRQVGVWPNLLDEAAAKEEQDWECFIAEKEHLVKYILQVQMLDLSQALHGLSGIASAACATFATASIKQSDFGFF